MRLLAAALLATAAFAVPASAEDCLTRYIVSDVPGGPVVTRNPDGSVTVHPNNAVATAFGFVGNTTAFVDCVV